MKYPGCFPPFVLLLALTPAAAQHAAHAIPIIPQAILERPVKLATGIGRAHDAVTTKSRDAQAFYDQGLAYLHSYVWIEAARAFHQALRLDPQLALAHVGLSYAYIELNKPADARAAMERAAALGRTASDHERRHIDVRALQMQAEASPRDAAKLAAYRKAIDAALEAFPADAELALLRGVAESQDPADRGQGATAAAVPYFERAMTIAPNHFAGHHYLTHALENAGRIEGALEHGAAYAKLAPEVPHARHMHGHNLRRLGRVDQAIAEFEAADALHRAYFTRERLAAEHDWHFLHNLDLLASSRQYLGQMSRAESLLKASFDLPSNLVVQVYNKREWPAFLRGRGRLEAALAAAKVMAGHPHPIVQAGGHIEAGYALLAMGRWGDAAAESNAALKTLKAGPEGAPLAGPAFQGLQGELALRTADRAKGRQLLGDLARKVRALPGPDGWTQALFMLEAIARTARQVGDWELAGTVAKQMVEHDPAYAGSHYALGLVADHDGNAAAARAELALARKYWSRADPDLPELADIRARLK